MSLIIIKSGILDTLQDAGRRGYRHWGINPGGSMDSLTATLANIILANDKNEPVVEMYFPASVYRCIDPIIICITGADLSPHVNHEKVPINAPILLKKDDVLSFKKQINGRVAYIAAQGGFEADEWLGSASTNLKLGVGGYEGKILRAGNILKSKKKSLHSLVSNLQETFIFPWRVNYQIEQDNIIFVLPSKEWNDLTEASQTTFTSVTYNILSQSDRMGFYLNGEKLNLIEKKEMVSFGVNFGSIQLLPSGQLIVLMADHQTTGGYPCIANVITAHRGKLAQQTDKTHLQFLITTPAEANRLLLKQKKFLNQLQSSCINKWR